MATKSISQLDTQATANETDLFEVAIVDANSASGYASKKESAAEIADAIVGQYQYPLRITGTTAKTVSGAINEVADEVADLKDLEGSASGDIASFVDGSDNPLKALTISIVATQSGTGDPSPENIRPISGWTGANVYVSGEDTSDPTTYNVNWQSTAGTVYGGTLDVKTGVLTVTHSSLVDLGDPTWNKNANGQYYSTGMVIPAESDISGQYIVCSAFKGGNAYNKSVNKSICCLGSRLWVYDSDLTYTGAEFKAVMAGVKVTYKMATPVIYQLTPVQVRSLLGQNNVWADCGSVTELKYTRDLNLCINDIISRIEALENASSSRSLSVSSVLTKSIVSDSNANEGKTEEQTEEETKEEAQNER